MFLGGNKMHSSCVLTTVGANFIVGRDGSIAYVRYRPMPLEEFVTLSRLSQPSRHFRFLS